jgi:hypothetical protein
MSLAEVMERLELCLGAIHGGGCAVKFSIKGAELILRSSLARSVGMAVNELVWNSCTHGFDPGQAGSVSVNTFVKNGTLRIEVRDNGRGIPDDFVLDRDANTGLAIVKNIVERDLSGSLSLRRQNGTVAAIEACIATAGRLDSEGDCDAGCLAEDVTEAAEHSEGARAFESELRGIPSGSRSHLKDGMDDEKTRHASRRVSRSPNTLPSRCALVKTPFRSRRS